MIFHGCRKKWTAAAKWHAAQLGGVWGDRLVAVFLFLSVTGLKSHGPQIVV